MYSPNPQAAPLEIDNGPLVVPESFLAQVKRAEAVQKQLFEQRELIKSTSRTHPDGAGERTEDIFVDLLKNLIPDEFKILQRARILADDPKESPQLDIVILKPGGEKLLNSMNYYPRESVLAVFECKLTLRKRDLVVAAKNANVIKGNYATGKAHHAGSRDVFPTCKPYYGLLALGWDGGDELENIDDLAGLLAESFRACSIGRQVDCVLVPELSFYSVTHHDLMRDGDISIGVEREPVVKMYNWPDGVRRPLAPPHELDIGTHLGSFECVKMEHHNSLIGLGRFLAHAVGECREDYKHLSASYAYYGHVLVSGGGSYKGPPLPKN